MSVSVAWITTLLPSLQLAMCAKSLVSASSWLGQWSSFIIVVPSFVTRTAWDDIPRIEQKPSGKAATDQHDSRYDSRFALLLGFDKKVFQGGIAKLSAGIYSGDWLPDPRLWRSSPFRLFSPKSYLSPTKWTSWHPAGLLVMILFMYHSCSCPNVLAPRVWNRWMNAIASMR